MRVVDVLVRAESPGEQRRNVTAQFVDCRHHYMRWLLVVELLYAFSEVGLVDVDTVTPHELAHAAFVHCHGLAFGHGLYIVLPEYVEYYIVVLFGVAGPVHMYSVGFGVGCELLQIAVELRQCV